MNLNCKCRKHPRYKAVLEPRSECEECWDAWYEAERQRGLNNITERS